MTVGDARTTREVVGGGPRGEVSLLQKPVARRGRRLVWAVVTVSAAGALAFIVGFLWFAERVAREGVVLNGRADGIVALTGGALRVADAVELLAAGHGQRLLITGVNRATNSVEIARRVPEYERLFACCIDLDHSAVNTIGNAIEARRWTLSRGFRSLVVVTSSYHMPRAMVELAHQLPDVRLIPFPVVTEKRRAEPWWSSGANAKLLMFEYVKYVVAVVRMRFDPPAGASEAAAGRSRAKS